MVYIVVGILGVVVAVVGAGLLLNGISIGGGIVTATGVVLAAVGLIGFGVKERRERNSAVRRLEELEAQEQLAERHERQEKEEASRRAERETEDRRQAQLRDLDHIRRAIIAELQKVDSGVRIGFAWGIEERHYWMEGDELQLQFSHRGTSAGWVWEAGRFPAQKGQFIPGVEDATAVNRGYQLIQPERYLVPLHLPGERLELPEPGYFGSYP
jgi:hypothetical protein